MWVHRAETWQAVQTTPEWDILIIGGGITGAGILRESARAGLNALLIEQRDFAWGTSSRSSKMVHGGLRYLRQGQFGVTYQSVRERESLLHAGRGLITPLGFLLPASRSRAGRLGYKIGLTVYDVMAQRRQHRRYTPDEFNMLAPRITSAGPGGFYFTDAQTDDARLVLRILQEAVDDGGKALNYVRAESLLKNEQGVYGAVLRDTETDETVEVRARVVINATGAWVDRLRSEVGGEAKIRPLRGSHLIFPAWRFPLAQAVSFFHPQDKRSVFVYPWEDTTLVGTTDIDHSDDLNLEPRISGEETAYLLAACNTLFPALDLTPDDVIATYAGVRPVIDTGKADPSKESRDHVVWLENGLLSVTGGKLTTFRVLALDALKAAKSHLPDSAQFHADAPPLNPLEGDLPVAANRLTETERIRLHGRYGAYAAALVDYAAEDELTSVPGTKTLWAELKWAAHAEGVIHLDDLLLRRTRLGLILPQGGMAHIDTIRRICAPELPWDATRWQMEIDCYQKLWQEKYSLPQRESIPDWRSFVPPLENRPAAKRSAWHTGIITVLIAGLVFFILTRRRQTT